ncbi:MAG: NTP transferase domain-containing protein, partial [Henriciella sp.]|nr:NTP transferase domain-containing protein [Henriciella sp.]
MTALSDIPCVILAGGGSRRFGSPKGLADFNGAPLISRIVEMISRQSSAPIAINANETRHYEAMALPILSDDADKAGIGPLA